MRRRFSLIFLILLSALTAEISFAQSYKDIIPKPVSVQVSDGVFMLTADSKIQYSDDRQKQNAELLSSYLAEYYGMKAEIKSGTGSRENIIFLRTTETENLPPEGYELSVNPERIEISGSPAGVFYGTQTLRQILPPEGNPPFKIQCLEIRDFPRFKWRGMHLDVCRHFFPKEFIKKYIDFIAMYRMNTFHWHLTDDQGWRIEIKKYPKLTETGAFRKGTLIGHYSEFPHKYDSIVYGGYYTQEDIREIVAYASARNITIVPEIEMPGHSLAALASYPELSCTGGPFEVERKWGVFEDVFCPREETFRFLEDVLSEVIGLFPSKYIHIGGDEVPKTRWKNCPHCQSLIEKEGLKDENELQSYFIRRIENFLNSKGRTIIGWDEILEGGLAPNAVVMSWRGTEGGIEAAKQNHYAVMSPGSHCYFDYYQGDPRYEPLAIGGYTTTEKVYSYEPVPPELGTGGQEYILGGQGNVWTEYIPDTKQVEYMVFPRICALSEVLWSPKESRDEYDLFLARLSAHFSHLDRYGINYSKSVYQIKSEVIRGRDGIEWKLIPPAKDGKIIYTCAGRYVSSFSGVYEYPLPVNGNITYSAYFISENGEEGKPVSQEFQFNKATGKRITLDTEPHRNYSHGGALTLVDGISGIIPWYGKQWLGFSGSDFSAVIDLGSKEEISRVVLGVLNAEYSWIYLPESSELSVSDDGKEYRSIKFITADEIQKAGREIIFDTGGINARYIRISAENFGKIPEGRQGAGKDAWLFVDEIKIF